MTTYIFGEDTVFTSRSDTTQINLKTGRGKTLIANQLQINSFKIDSTISYISYLEDLPIAVAGVITLLEGACYFLTGSLDLLGSRLVFSQNTCLYGISSEISFLTSTGLDSNTALITSTFTANLRDLSIYDVGKAFDFQAAAQNTYVCDWRSVNIIDAPVIGTIKDYDNFIIETSTFIRSSNLTFSGRFGTIGFSNSLLTNTTQVGSILTFNSTCVITRRIKIVESSIVVTTGKTAISIDPAATIPNSGLILTSLNFSGGGTYLSGVSAGDNIALFFKCLGISNSQSRANFHLLIGASIAQSQNNWVTISGSTTAPSSTNSKFTHSDNLLTYTGSLTQVFLVSYSCSYTGTNGNIINTGISISGAVPIDDTISTSTMSASGRIEVVSNTFFVELTTGATLRIQTMNKTSSASITPTQLSLTVSGIF